VINADDYRPEGLERSTAWADGLYRLSDTQAQEILQMRLQRLTGLEQDKIVAEYREVMAEIDDLLDILARPERVSTIITRNSPPSSRSSARPSWARAAAPSSTTRRTWRPRT
jgi:DNA gyrase subunit A